MGVGAFLAVAALGLAATFMPRVLWPDSPVPPSLAAFLPAARQQLWSEATDGLRLPLHLTFVDARCAANGSVAVIFEEHRPPYTESHFAYAVRDSMPMAADDAWSGGYGISGSVFDDGEFTWLMGHDTIPCDR